ncbi:MAG: sensor domain-containing diguanylate cyclase [Elusimicrobia bacterium]|nr:sensor domain-containing diguanylate cyclase [Candidatus Liberimonas magnetica]
MIIKDNVEIKKQVTEEIIKTIGIPMASSLLFIIWAYSLIRGSYENIYIFPLSGILLILLYFFSEAFYSGILLGILTLIGLLSIILIPSSLSRFIFFLEIFWLWSLFFFLERYQKSYQNELNRVREEEEVLDTKITLLNSRVEENRRLCENIAQRIANYQLLGGMVQILGSTLDEDKIIPLVIDLSRKFIAKGTWSIGTNLEGDDITKYVKETSLSLIINDIEADNRFYITDPVFRSLVAVPLEINEKLWGVLRGESLQKNTFDESDLRLLSILGGITSLALNNANLYERTQELAITDGLTGLYVQSYFKERLAEEILRSQDHKLSLSVIILDIDHFKKFNDTYGHAAGDAVLRQIANILRNCLRETDLISRYGGEEFAILMLQTELNEAFRIAEIIRNNIEVERFYLPVESFQPVRVRVTISAGASGLNPRIKTPEELLHLADEALYRSKKGGRNRVEMARPLKHKKKEQGPS